MNKLLFTLFLFPLSFNALCQQLGIQHFQRSTNSYDFVLPSEPFSPEGLLIVIPDSLYNFGSVDIKTARFKDFNAKNCSILFESDTVKTVQFTLTGKKNYQNYLNFIKSKNITIPNFKAISKAPFQEDLRLNDTHQIVLSIQKKGRKSFFTITLN